METEWRHDFAEGVADPKDVFARYPLDRLSRGAVQAAADGGRFGRLYRAPAIPIAQRVRAARVLRRANLDVSWFETFAEYWTSVLGGRVLWGIEDFDFLRGWYRLEARKNQVPDTNDPETHLAAWQSSGLVYHLFHQVYYETRHPSLALLELIRRERRFRTMLEFGCATAPMTTWMATFLGLHGTDVFLSDLETLALHYAGYKFGGHPNVHVRPLSPQNAFAPDVDVNVDVVFCLTVFEHLNQPLRTVESFHEHLAPGGLLFFDYLKTGGVGLDTGHAVRERDSVLDFVEKHFEVVYGKIVRNGNTGLVVAKKR
jgi:SAM-dependent methyltransferase